MESRYLSRVEKEFDELQKFIEEANLNLTVTRANGYENGYIAWKVIHESPIDDNKNPDESTEMQSIKSTIIVEFTDEYPFKPPVLFCSDSTQHSFLGEGNRISFNRLRDTKTEWLVWTPIILILAGVHDLFISYLSTNPQLFGCASPQVLAKKPDFDMKIPQTAIEKFLDFRTVHETSTGMNSVEQRRIIKLYDDEWDLAQIDNQLGELKARRIKVLKAIKTGLGSEAGLRRSGRRRKNQNEGD
ncbi:unnamed protein product [Oikopleura dioica]|uniref:Uncharacterized protein n=1 Tax=Oikopleura dioica TaxID=34765 RepID=E4Z143_OIKDI|nr:unnamed protein product [Oikopleura dioica]CBY41922.1 unnamed protein product [Oikopleura dioica]